MVRMQVAQRYTSVNEQITTNGYYPTVDRFRCY